MARRIALVLAATLLVVACSDDGESTEDPVPAGPGTLDEQAVVFGPDEVETSVEGDEVTWTPTARDVRRVDQALKVQLVAEPEPGVGPFEEHHRQYVGVGEEGEVVAVNALCDVEGVDWEGGLVAVADGGPCFWHAQVTVATATVQTLVVNGEA